METWNIPPYEVPVSRKRPRKEVRLQVTLEGGYSSRVSDKRWKRIPDTCPCNRKGTVADCRVRVSYKVKALVKYQFAESQRSRGLRTDKHFSIYCSILVSHNNIFHTVWCSFNQSYSCVTVHCWCTAFARCKLYMHSYRATCKSRECVVCLYFLSVLPHCWLGGRKGIRPVKSWVLACWWWHSDWSFPCLIAPVVTTTSVISSSNKIQNGDIMVPA